MYPAPEKMKIPELVAFESIDMKKASFTWKNFKGSAIYMGNIAISIGVVGCFGAMLVAKVLADKFSRDVIQGPTGNGGSYLDLWTNRSTKDYAYNREFQRMKYLEESLVGNDSNTYTNRQLMADLGKPVKQRTTNK